MLKLIVSSGAYGLLGWTVGLGMDRTNGPTGELILYMQSIDIDIISGSIVVRVDAHFDPSSTIDTSFFPGAGH